MKNRVKKGFGIVEVLISSSMIMIIIAALTAAGKSTLNSSTYIHERSQAAFLASEGLEAMRQLRDTYWIDESNATNFKTNINNLIVSMFPTRNLCWNNITNKFSLLNTTCDVTLDRVTFRRTITFSRVGNGLIQGFDVNAKADDTVKVTVRITWDDAEKHGDLSVSEILTNWRPNY